MSTRLCDNRPHRSYTPLARDIRFKDPFFTTVYHTVSVDVVRFRDEAEGKSWITSLDNAGYTMWDPAKPPEPEPVAQRYIVVSVPKAGQVIVDVDEAKAIKTYTDTPAGRRAANRYLEKLNK